MPRSSPPHVDDGSVRRVVVGLGTNLGDRWRHLATAVRGVSRLGNILARSSVYETQPVGGPSQGPYLNAALLLETPAPLRGLLASLFFVEAEAGRERRERWAPRTLDLDLLWAGSASVAEPGLLVPHPRLRERAFALAPLLDLVPDAVDPVTLEPYAVVLARLGTAGVVRVADRFPQDDGFL